MGISGKSTQQTRRPKGKGKGSEARPTSAAHAARTAKRHGGHAYWGSVRLHGRLLALVSTTDGWIARCFRRWRQSQSWNRACARTTGCRALRSRCVPLLWRTSAADVPWSRCCLEGRRLGLWNRVDLRATELELSDAVEPRAWWSSWWQAAGEPIGSCYRRRRRGFHRSWTRARIAGR